jgi:hypothetical protein
MSWKLAAAFVCGLGVAGAAVVAATDFPYSTTKSRLIDAWRKVEPGMDIDEVDVRLGAPAYDFAAGEGWPAWATVAAPEEVRRQHGLRVFMVAGMGPQLLLVIYDDAGHVFFVTSRPT